MNTERTGDFVVVEGTDGSGKGTQIEPLARHIESLGRRVQIMDFPRYANNIWGEMIGDYLKGNFGERESLHPRYAALPYMLDRVLATPIINKWLADGDFVIANRYTPSNLAFMSARVEKDRRADFIDWMKRAEYEQNSIPKEDLVLLLNVTPDVSFRNVDKKDARDYLAGRKKDIHEDDLGYQRNVASMYQYLASTENHWRVIDCMDGSALKAPEIITRQLIKVLETENLIRKTSYSGL